MQNDLKEIFVKDGGTGSGLTSSDPCGTLEKAFSMLPKGGRIVICGVTTAASFTACHYSDTVTVTSVSGSRDFRTEGAAIAYPASVTVTLNGPTHFEDLDIQIATTGVIAANFSPVVFGAGVDIAFDQSADENGLYLVGGNNNGNDAAETTSACTNITVESGYFSRICGFSRNCGPVKHTGRAEISVCGTARVKYLLMGAMNGDATANGGRLILSDSAVIENLFTGGNTRTNTMSGDVYIDVNGGDIFEINCISLLTNLGKRILTYDPRTVADGIVKMAELAAFDSVRTVCERDGRHTYGKPAGSAFDPDVMVRTCLICGHTEPVCALPSGTHGDVVYAADGGFGDGSDPALPLGSYEAAVNALRETGGRIVVIAPLAILPNTRYKFGDGPDFFQGEQHENKILVTSVHGGKDYRKTGAKLFFPGDTDYRLAGPAEFDNIVFSASEGTTVNTIAARCYPLIFGPGCFMEKTKADGYSLNVVAGYKYFRYTDFHGVKIDDELIDMCTPSRLRPDLVSLDSLPDHSPIALNPKYSLRAAAAAALNRMLSDMADLGMHMPVFSDAARFYVRQYECLFRQVGRLRRIRGYTFREAFDAVIKSCSPPGASEHHLGFAVDMYDNTLSYGNQNHHHYNETKEWAWIMENGHKYGFILRFTDKTAVTGFIRENWHFRYVGPEHATAMKGTSYCLEEYAGQILGMFDKDTELTVNGGSFDKICAGSIKCEGLHFTGGAAISIGKDAEISVLDMTGVNGKVMLNADRSFKNKTVLSGDASAL